jgi:lysylphosphatidylglycerol synthase-like protein
MRPDLRYDSEAPMRRDPPLGARLRPLAYAAFSLGIFAYALSGVDAAEVGRLIAARGPALAIALLPPVATLGADTIAWRRLLACWGHRPPWLRLWPARVAVEAVALTVPGGTVLGEGFKPALLAPFGVPVGHAVASTVAHRWWHMRAHAAFVVASGVVGYAPLVTLSYAVTGTFALVPSLFASALSPLVISLTIEAACNRGSLGARSFALLVRVLPARFGEALERRREHFDATDGAFEMFAATPAARVVPAAVALFGVWLLESFDSWVALHAVGGRLEYRHIMALEGGLSLLRAAAVFAPAGLGVQDFGYLRGLEAFGVPPATAAAFVLVKRAKDLTWAVVGYALLATLLRRVRRGVSSGEA